MIYVASFIVILIFFLLLLLHQTCHILWLYCFGYNYIRRGVIHCCIVLITVSSTLDLVAIQCCFVVTVALRQTWRHSLLYCSCCYSWHYVRRGVVHCCIVLVVTVGITSDVTSFTAVLFLLLQLALRQTWRHSLLKLQGEMYSTKYTKDGRKIKPETTTGPITIDPSTGQAFIKYRALAIIIDRVFFIIYFLCIFISMSIVFPR